MTIDIYRTMAVLGCGAFAVGCAPTSSRTPTVRFEPETSEPPCEITIDNTHPAANAEEVFYRTALRFEFSETDPTVAVSVSGTNGSGAWLDDETYAWQPDLPLAPASEHTVQVSWCDGRAVESFVFRTSDTGSAPVEVAGRTYRVDLDSGRLVDPPGVGALLASQLVGDFVVGFEEVDGVVRMVHAVADGEVQDLCQATTVAPLDFSANPFYLSEQVPYLPPFEGESFPVEATFWGAFVPDGSRIEGMSMRGHADLRDSTGDLCGLIHTFGIDCEPCDDGVVACMELFVEDLHAEEVHGLTLVHRTPEQVEAECQ